MNDRSCFTGQISWTTTAKRDIFGNELQLQKFRLLYYTSFFVSTTGSIRFGRGPSTIYFQSLILHSFYKAYCQFYDFNVQICVVFFHKFYIQFIHGFIIYIKFGKLFGPFWINILNWFYPNATPNSTCSKCIISPLWIKYSGSL